MHSFLGPSGLLVAVHAAKGAIRLLAHAVVATAVEACLPAKSVHDEDRWALYVNASTNRREGRQTSETNEFQGGSGGWGVSKGFQCLAKTRR